MYTKLMKRGIDKEEEKYNFTSRIKIFFPSYNSKNMKLLSFLDYFYKSHFLL